MRAPGDSSPATALLVAAAVLTLVACVPRPAGKGGAPTATAATADGSSPASTRNPAATSQAAPVGPTPIPSFVRPTPLPAPTFLVYTVKGGDTLTSIAREFRTTPRSIAFWSRAEHPSLDPESSSYQPDRLTIGWVLLLVPGAVFDEDELMDATPSPTPSANPSYDGSPTPTAS